MDWSHEHEDGGREAPAKRTMSVKASAGDAAQSARMGAAKKRGAASSIIARWCGLACGCLYPWTCPAYGQNDIVLHQGNGNANYIALSNPSEGLPAGSFPPDLSGDLFWRVLPGNRVLAFAGTDGSVMNLNGFMTLFADSNGSTASSFYDMLLGPALESPGHTGTYEPAFFQQGLTSEIMISLGPTGLPDPCAIAGMTCDPPGCPAGSLSSWAINVTFDTGILVPANGTSSSDLAVTWFVPGGMSVSDALAPCPGGDYAFQGILVTDETQADDVGGLNALSGYQVAGSTPKAWPVHATLAGSLVFAERTLNVIADSGIGVGFERGVHGGGATNGLKLAVASGASRLSYEIRAAQDVGVPNQAFVGTAFVPLALPGSAVLGANLLLLPDALFLVTVGMSAESSVPVVTSCLDSDYLCFGTDADGSADFASPPLSPGSSTLHFPIPGTAVGIDVYSQGFVLHLATAEGFSTNRVRTSFLP